MVEAYTDTDEAFLRQLILAEEDRLRLYPTVQWTGGFRWLPNVVPIEQWRRQEEGEMELTLKGKMLGHARTRRLRSPLSVAVHITTPMLEYELRGAAVTGQGGVVQDGL